MMYAAINLPGSSHFHYFGPATKQECQEWLRTTVERLSRTESATSLLPQRIVTNRDAESWRYRDGSRVCCPYEGATPDDCPDCGKPEWASSHALGCPRDSGAA